MKLEMDISFFYVGRRGNYDDFIIPKIGETGRKLSERAKEIRKEYADFKMLGCLALFDVTQAQRRHIESEVRAKMEKYGKNVKNDYFHVPARAKKYRNLQYASFALIALGYAIDCCRREGYHYLLQIS